jgi:ubiquinone/menaquinone biosynthesis C-methylase UbiE
MNEGYAALTPGETQPVLALEDREFQYHINLLDQIYRHVDCTGLDVVEVGCGQGGGVYYCARYLKARRVTGVDLSSGNIAAARANFPLQNVDFQVGNAMKLPFARRSFDVVVNIESSHLYPDAPRFFREAHRILRTGGSFLFVDLGSVERMRGLRAEFEDSGFVVGVSRDITKNVMASIQKDNDRRTAILRSMAQSEDQFKGLADWARMPGTEGFERYRRGEDQYWAYVLKKA